MKKLTPKGIKVLKSCHLIFVMIWVVGVITMGVISLSNPQSGDELYMSFHITRFVDDFLVIPGAILTTFTGIIYGAFTNWGFFKHRWIIVKWIISLTVIIVGTFIFSPWLDTCLEISDKLRDAAIANPDVLHYSGLIFSATVVQSAVLLFLVVISVFKPWKKTKK